jgi:hypothetical protein
MSMNFIPLFTTAKVLRAAQQITMSAVFFFFLTQRLRDGRKIPRSRRRFDPRHD